MATVLLIDNFKIFEKWASKTYEFKLKQLKEDSRFDVIDIDELKDVDITKYKTLIFGWNLCIYSKYYTLKHAFYSKKIKGLETFSEIKAKTKQILQFPKKYLIVQDFINPDDYQYGLKSLILYLKNCKFKGIITPYLNTPATQPVRNELPELEIVHLPHHIDENIFKNWELEKDCDIFIYGNCKSARYPFRNKILNILKKLDSEKKCKIVFWNDLMSRNYFRYNAGISNENLSQQINKSWLTVCTCSYADALLGKYFETSMSNSCVLGNMASDGKKIWKDNYIKIEEEMKDEEIEKIILTSLENKDLLKKHIEKMSKLVKTYYLSKIGDRLYYGLR